MSDFIQYAYDLSAKGHGRLAADQIIKGLQSHDLAWVHLDGSNDHSLTWLENELSFLDPFIVAALTAEETRPRVTALGDGMLMILRTMNFNPAEQEEDMISIRFYIDDERVISIARKPVKSISEIAQDIESHIGPKDAGHFLRLITHHITAKVDEAVANLDDEMDDTERNFIANPAQNMQECRRKLSDLRLRAIKIRRYLSPQREVLFEQKSAQNEWICDTDRRSLHESYNKTVRAVEELDAIRERAQIVKDEISSAIGDTLNRNTYVLSLIAAVFLPLGFLTGLFGMNIGGLPGVDVKSAFAIFCAVMIILVAMQIFIFKRLKWL